MDYNILKRKRLQKLCKKHNIPCNQSSADMANALNNMNLAADYDILLRYQLQALCKKQKISGKLTNARMAEELKKASAMLVQIEPLARGVEVAQQASQQGKDGEGHAQGEQQQEAKDVQEEVDDLRVRLATALSERDSLLLAQDGWQVQLQRVQEEVDDLRVRLATTLSERDSSLLAQDGLQAKVQQCRWDIREAYSMHRKSLYERHLPPEKQQPSYAERATFGVSSSVRPLYDPARALSAPITALLPRALTRVRQVDPHTRLLQALELIVDGAQNLIVPIESLKRLSFKKISQKIGSAKNASPTSHEGKEFCWITQEDVLRFLLGFIGVFSPLPSMTIEDLGIVKTEVLTVEYDKPAATALSIIKQASRTQTAVAVIEHDPLQGPKLIGEIAPSTLMCCDETVALALATLSAGDFMAYVDCGGPPESLVEIVRRRIDLKTGISGEGEQGSSITTSKQNYPGKQNQMTDPWEESSDEEFCDESPTGPLENDKKWSRLCSFKSNKFGYASRSCRASPLTCRPWSSLVAVMVQALAHRVNYVWVTDEESNLVGIVTFLDILGVFWNHLQTLD